MKEKTELQYPIRKPMIFWKLSGSIQFFQLNLLKSENDIKSKINLKL